MPSSPSCSMSASPRRLCRLLPLHLPFSLLCSCPRCAGHYRLPAVAGLQLLEEKPSEAGLQVPRRMPGRLSMAATRPRSWAGEGRDAGEGATGEAAGLL
nr:unnamed protein product [Digitaria exilis]